MELDRLGFAFLAVRSRTGGTAGKQALGIVEQLLLPALNLVGVQAMPLGQFRHRRILANSLQSHLRLQGCIKLLRVLAMSLAPSCVKKQELLHFNRWS